MINVLLPFFTLMFAGYLSRYVPGFPKSEVVRRVLTLSTLWFFLPAIILRVLARATPDRGYIVISAVAIAGVLTSLAICFCTYKAIGILFKKSSKKILKPEVMGVLLIGSAWGNITFLGLPLLTLFYGSETARIAMLYDVFGIGPLLYTLGAFIAAAHSTTVLGENERKQKLRAGLLLFIKTPPLWAACLGLLLSFMSVQLPGFIDQSLEILGRAVTPLMIFSVGLALQLPRTVKDWLFIPWLLPAAMVKLVVAPLISIGILKLLSNSGVNVLSALDQKALILEAGMSTMVVTLVLSDLFDLDTKVCAKLIALTTLLSFVTIPWFV